MSWWHVMWIGIGDVGFFAAGWTWCHRGWLRRVEKTKGLFESGDKITLTDGTELVVLAVREHARNDHE